jgi:hypothetical protein
LGQQGGVDINGQPVSIPLAVGFTFEFCVTRCGTSAKPFEWAKFSEKFSAWLLPYLALVSQLPFGAQHRWGNFMSVVLAVGCPTLAAYSLCITVLNGRWAARRFRGISYPNVQYALRIMNSLQQAPLQITNSGSQLTALVVLPENNNWWRDLAERLHYTHTWTISSATSVAWVFIAYLFTVIDTFTTLAPNPSPDGLSDGQAVGSVWLWLLAVVSGWLHVSPECDHTHLRNAVARANSTIGVGATNSPSETDIVPEVQALTIRGESGDTIYNDEQCTAPIFNYARFLPWSQNVEEVVAAFHSASRQAGQQLHDNLSGWQSRESNLEVSPDDLRGSVEQMGAFLNDSRRSHWGPGVLSRFLLASAGALFLQWGTAAAAIIIVWYTPTIGLGCRSLSYLLYASLSMLSWMLLVTSSFLTHYFSLQHRHPSYKPRPKTGLFGTVRLLAIIFRRLGKFLAACNAVVIIAACTLQFANLYNECYCNSAVIGLRARAYDVIVISASELKGPWLGGVTLACVCAVSFVGFVNLFSPSL